MAALRRLPPLLLPMLLLSGARAWMLGEGPDPLAGTGYSSEHGNFLCSPFFGVNETGDNYELPCRPPREDWDSPFMEDEFVITAWWPPTMNVIHQYAAAGFNMVMGGNMLQGCQINGTLQANATATEAFECFAAQLPILDGLGLKVACEYSSPRCAFFCSSNEAAAQTPAAATATPACAAWTRSPAARARWAA